MPDHSHGTKMNLVKLNEWLLASEMERVFLETVRSLVEEAAEKTKTKPPHILSLSFWVKIEGDDERLLDAICGGWMPDSGNFDAAILVTLEDGGGGRADMVCECDVEGSSSSYRPATKGEGMRALLEIRDIVVGKPAEADPKPKPKSKRKR